VITELDAKFRHSGEQQVYREIAVSALDLCWNSKNPKM